jgi:hypothetical protein
VGEEGVRRGRGSGEGKEGVRQGLKGVCACVFV